jgi:hypothetical protein
MTLKSITKSIRPLIEINAIAKGRKIVAKYKSIETERIKRNAN